MEIRLPLFFTTAQLVLGFLVLNGQNQPFSASDLMIPNGHFDLVNCLDISPDGKYLASGGSDRQTLIWDIETGHVVKALQAGGDHFVQDCQFTPDGNFLLTSVSFSHKVQLWDIGKGEVVREFSDNQNIMGKLLSGGKQVMTFGDKANPKLWDRFTGQLLRTYEGSSGSSNPPVFSKDEKRMLTVDNYNSIVLWDMETAKKLQTFVGHTNRADAYAFGANNDQILTGSWDRTARLWDAKTGQMLQEFKGHTFYVNDVEMTHDGKRLLTSSSDNTARLWDVETGKQLFVFGPYKMTGRIRNTVFTKDGKQVVIASWGGYDGTLEVWDIDSLKLVHSFQQDRFGSNAVIFSQSEKQLFNSGMNQIKQWDIATGQLIKSFRRSNIILLNPVFSPDGKYLAMLGDRLEVDVIDLTTGSVTTSLRDTIRGYEVCDFSPDSKWLVSINSSGKVLYLKRLDATGKEVVLSGHRDGINNYDFSLDGKYVLTASSDSTVILWDIATGKLLHRFTGHTNYVWHSVFSPNGKWMFSMGWDGKAMLWDVATKKRLYEYPVEAYNDSRPVFTADSKYLLYQNDEGSVSKVEVSSGKELYRFRSNPTREFFNGKYIVTCDGDNLTIDSYENPGQQLGIPLDSNLVDIGFHPNGKGVLLVEANSSVQLWDMETGRNLFKQTTNSQRLRHLAIHPSGKYFTTTDANQRLQFWNMENGEELLTFVLQDDKGWLFMQPDGDFDASPTAMERLYFAKDFKTKTLSDMAKQNAKQGLLVKTLKPE